MRALVRSSGPTTAVAARNGVGFSSAEAYLVERHGPDQAVAEVPFAAERPVAAGDRLTWVWFPERVLPAGRAEPTEADLDGFWDATAFALDVVFTDGSRASASARDQYAVPMTPEAQDDARMLWVDQWNRRTVDLTPFAGRTVDRLEARLGRADRVAADGAAAPLRGWLDDVRIVTAPPRASRPLDHVVTTRGTHASSRFSRGNTAPLVAVPHGGVFGLPMTDASDPRWPYAYHEHVDGDGRPALQAFATSHIPSPWMGDRGVFQIMPSPLVEPDTDRAARALPFDRADELAGPHRYRVAFDGGVTAEMTAGEFALGFRFTFPGERASVVLDHHGVVRSASVRVEDGVGVVDALLDDRPQTPPHHVHLRVHGVVTDRTTVEDGRLGGWFVVDGTAPVDVLIGISTVSAEDAAANLRAAGDVDAMCAEAERRWSAALATMSFEGASEDQLVSLYSGLYRLFLYPNTAGETALTGEPRYRSPYGTVLDTPVRDEPGPEVGSGPFATTNGFWDTYRTAWPLLALLTPERTGALAEGFVQHHRDGGWTPRWSAPGAEDVMTGTTSDTVFADLAAKGVPGFDLATAYRSAVRNATVPSPDPRVGRKGVLPGAFRGYVDTDTHEGMSWTLDAAINDWGLAVMARLLADRAVPGSSEAERLDAEAEWFARRSLQYRNVFHPGLGFFVGRRPDGDWRVEGEAFDPAEWGTDYTETNAWGTMVTAPHDGAGVMALHGGPEGLLAAMARFRAAGETGATDRSGSYGFAIHEMTEARDVRMGMLGLSNQPAHHIPFAPMWAGRHDDAHATLRECVTRLFVGSDLGQGYPGDEDNGEMSAWYVFVTIGLYPLAPATGTYVLVPPTVRRTELHLGDATTVVEVAGPCRGPYVASVTVDGEPWESVSIPHAVIARGAHVVFTLSDEPLGWAAGSRPVSASELHGFADTPADVLPVGASPVTDDTGRSVVRLAAGEPVEVPVSVAAASLYTVTVAEPGTYGWTVAWVDADGRVATADERVGEEFAWAAQTRVFRIAGGVERGAIRFTASRPVGLTQLEVVAASRSTPGR
ncbi:GH92 family glycosyl hydrolase [Curtobacterium sp. MCBD17_019]|uniref:GH92 family glycosyl hydrolase n=1 Tax=Curtobacterium sp. MCBD17_019 TaxID=2175669 RepID=UPI0021AD29B0|nr:GH92 family glycosyl hydrolase [Curtobacterium sp. MCBD17_019]